MKFVSIILLLLLGISILRLISNKFSLLELLGLSFPIGTGIMSFYAFCINLMGFDFNRINILGGIIVLMLLINTFSFIRKGKVSYTTLPIDKRGLMQMIKNIQIIWVVGIIALAYILYAISVKSLYWPTLHYDAINGYDLLAKQIAHEKTLQEALFNPIWSIQNVRTLYPPLITYSLAYPLIMGFEYSKICCVLFFISVIISFYAFIQKTVNPVSAIFFTVLLAITPEFLAQSAMVMTNVPHVAYTMGGLLPMYFWITRKEDRYLYLSVLLLTLGVWAKTETILFSFAAGIAFVGALLSRRKTNKLLNRKNISRLLIFVIGTTGLFFLWELYSTSFPGIKELKQPISSSFIWDTEKIKLIMHHVYLVTIKGTIYYGYLVYLFLFSYFIDLLIQISNRKYRDTNHIIILTTFILIPWLAYIVTFYQLDVSSNHLVGYIKASYKRSFFNFLPLMLFFVANTRLVHKLFDFLFHPWSSQKEIKI